MKFAARGSRKRWKARNDSKGQEPEKNEFFEVVLRREDKKRKLAQKLPKEADEGARVEDDTMGANGLVLCATWPSVKLVWIDRRRQEAGAGTVLNNARPRIARSSSKLARGSGKEKMGEMRTRTTRVSVVMRPWWESSR